MAKELYRLKLKSLSYVSSVDTPAQETAVARLIKRRGDQQIAATARVAKVSSDELGLVFGWALTTKVDGVDYFDLQGDAIQEDELIKIAAEWMSSGGAADTMHDREQDGRAIFAMPMTTEVAKAAYGDKIGGELGTYGLLVAIRPSPEDFAKFKSGELTGFSIDGTGIREPVQARKSADKRYLTDEALGHQHEVNLFNGGDPWMTDATAEGAQSPHRHTVSRGTDGTLTVLADSGHTHTLTEWPRVVVVEEGTTVIPEAVAARATNARKSSPTFAVGDRVEALADHMPGMAGMLGKVTTVRAGEPPYYGVTFDDQTAMPGEHKWLAEDEIEPATDENAKRAARESPQSKKSPTVKPHFDTSTRKTAMDPTQELADLKALKEKLDAKIAELEAANTELKATAEMTDGEKAHLATLAGSEAKRFRSLEKSARLAEVEKANEPAYTCVDGTVIRKSDGALALKLAKQADEALKTAQAEKSARETVELTKRATETIGKLAGRSQVHVALLKAAEGIEGEIEVDGKKLKIADEAVKTLKAANDAMTAREKAAGFSGSQDEQPDGPQAELDALVAKHAADHKCDARTARLAVVKTDEGRRLYGEIEDLRKSKSLGARN